MCGFRDGCNRLLDLVFVDLTRNVQLAQEHIDIHGLAE
jgi:hypothetical protein